MVMFDGKELVAAIVVWNDCELMEEGWHTEEELRDFVDQPQKRMHSIGWVICSDDRWIVLAQSVGDDENRDGFTVCDVVKIPKEMVREHHMIDTRRPVLGGTREPSNNLTPPDMVAIPGFGGEVSPLTATDDGK